MINTGNADDIANDRSGLAKIVSYNNAVKKIRDGQEISSMQ